MDVQEIAPYFLHFPPTRHKIRCRKCSKISLIMKIGRINSVLKGVYKFVSVLSSSIWMQVGIRGTVRTKCWKIDAGQAVLF